MMSLSLLLFSLLSTTQILIYTNAFPIYLQNLEKKFVNGKLVEDDLPPELNKMFLNEMKSSPWFAPWHPLSDVEALHIPLKRKTRHEVHKTVSTHRRSTRRRRLLQAVIDEDLAPELSPTGPPKPFTMPKDTYIPMNSTAVLGSPRDIGEYFAYVALGTPPQYFNLSIATARDYVWVPCRCKTRCGTIDGRLKNYTNITNKVFDPKRSSSYQPIPCGSLCISLSTFSNDLEKIKCGESITSPGNCGFTIINSLNGTANGEFSTDIFQFYAPKKKVRARIRFGCASLLKNDSYYPQGVLGLGRGGAGTYSQLFQSNLMKNFWLCFESDMDSISTGYIGFNYTQTYNFTLRASASPLLTTANGTSNDSPLYAIEPMEFSVGSNTIYPALESLVLDSGRSMSNFPRDVYDNFLAAIEADSNYKFLEDDLEGLNCTMYKDDDTWSTLNKSFPIVTLSFFYSDTNNNLPPYTWSVLPYQYLRPALIDTDYFCVALTSNPGFPILGSNWMQNKFIEFDLQQKRLWWMDMNCTEGKQIEIITDTTYAPPPPPPHAPGPTFSQKSSSSTLLPSTPLLLALVAISCMSFFMRMVVAGV